MALPWIGTAPNEPVTLTAQQRQALAKMLHDIETNDGLSSHLDFCEGNRDVIVPCIEAINAIDGGTRKPSDYLGD